MRRFASCPTPLRSLHEDGEELLTFFAFLSGAA
jgi:hypothetical protein